MSRFAVRSVLFLGLATLVLSLATLGLSFASAEEPAKKDEQAEKKVAGPFVHVALYTFKADAPAGTITEFAAEAEKVFAKIDSVRSFRIGQPAAKATPREFMVDPKKAYHLGVVLTFDNFDGMAKYGNDQRHNELKKKYAKHFEKIVAYDFEDVPGTAEKPVAATAKVSGIVTNNGHTISSAVMRLHQKNGQVARAEIKDGSYSIDSLPAGRYVVTLEGTEVPAKYGKPETSALTANVQAGANAFDFALTGAGSAASR